MEELCACSSPSVKKAVTRVALGMRTAGTPDTTGRAAEKKTQEV